MFELAVLQHLTFLCERILTQRAAERTPFRMNFLLVVNQLGFAVEWKVTHLAHVMSLSMFLVLRSGLAFPAADLARERDLYVSELQVLIQLVLSWEGLFAIVAPEGTFLRMNSFDVTDWAFFVVETKVAFLTFMDDSSFIVGFLVHFKMLFRVYRFTADFTPEIRKQLRLATHFNIWLTHEYGFSLVWVLMWVMSSCFNM